MNGTLQSVLAGFRCFVQALRGYWAETAYREKHKLNIEEEVYSYTTWDKTYKLHVLFIKTASSQKFNLFNWIFSSILQKTISGLGNKTDRRFKLLTHWWEVVTVSPISVASGCFYGSLFTEISILLQYFVTGIRWQRTSALFLPLQSKLSAVIGPRFT